MKSFPSLLMYYVTRRATRRNLMILSRFFFVLTLLITAYSVTFHELMQREGQEHTWITGFYWTLTVMSTLGFGDITFHTDLGRIFSMGVLLTGMLFMLTLLPFTFIQFFYAPWMEAQSSSRARRTLPSDMEGHAILIHDDEITRALIQRLEQYEVPYVMVAEDTDTALKLHDEGLHVLVGELDDIETYKNLRVEQAALLAATESDVVNTAAASTVRGLAKELPIIATAKDEHSVDILELAGCNHVLRLGQVMGQSLARRIVAGDAMTHIVGQFDDLCIAEATAANTPLIGKTLAESNLREHVSVNVVGVWERGEFQLTTPETVIHQNSILVLAGSKEQLMEYDELFCIYNASDAPILIIGGGRVGRATGEALEKRGVDYKIVEKVPERVRDNGRYVVGSAANIDILKEAGIDACSTAVITTHDDDLNVYLTIYCRQLRPDIQIISRATLERNTGTLHRAGADFVMSYASMGANTIFNLLKRSNILMVAEGLDLFRMQIPKALVGKKLAATDIRADTGCTIVAYQDSGTMHINPDPQKKLPANCEIVVIGNMEAEKAFFKRYGTA